MVTEASEWAKHPVKVLVNNVGIQTDNGKPVHLLTEQLWDDVINVNLKSYFMMAKHCIPAMLEADGTVQFAPERVLDRVGARAGSAFRDTLCRAPIELCPTLAPLPCISACYLRPTFGSSPSGSRSGRKKI